MAYADYTFYSGTYMGTLPQAEFERLAERASDYIDSRTNYVFSGNEFESGIIELRVQKACCAVAEVYEINENGGGKAAESVDGYSVTYVGGKVKSADERLDSAIKMYLAEFVRDVSWV